MEEPVTDGDEYARHLQIVIPDVVNPISHSISSSSSVTPLSPNFSSFSPNDGSAVQKVPGSDGIRSSTATPKNMLGTSKFTLPEDWFVEKVPRKVGGAIDKYYRDPKTGRYFRSLKEVERYITEGVRPRRSKLKKPKNHPQKKSSCQDLIVADTKMLDVEEGKSNEYQLANVSPPTSVSLLHTAPFQLPYGWVVKEVPRTSGDHADKYYYEPGSGHKFRSLLAVQKHVEELEENSPLSLVLEELRQDNLPISKAFKLSTNIKNHGSYNSWKKSSISRKEKRPLDGSPPSKINWVIGGSDTWNAFVNNTLVSDSVKQQWDNSFYDGHYQCQVTR